MENEEFSNYLEKYGLKSEILELPFSPGSQDSLSNIRLDSFDVHAPGTCDTAATCSEQFLDSCKDYKLEVSFESQETVTKSAAWTYSESLNRLYVNISQPCPVRLRLMPEGIAGAILRCRLAYQKSDYRDECVAQCANHSTLESNISLKGHVLRCKDASVQYEKDPYTGHYNLCVPFSNSQGDGDWYTYVLEFKCLSTCLGRRAMELVFQVEYAGQVHCQHSLNVRVCSCPGRDRRHDEFQNKKSAVQETETQLGEMVPLVPIKRHFPDEEEFTIRVKGRKNYELLVTLKQRLELADAHEKQLNNTGLDKVMPVKEQTKELTHVKAAFDRNLSDGNHLPHHRRHHYQHGQHSSTRKLRKARVMPFTEVTTVYQP